MASLLPQPRLSNPPRVSNPPGKDPVTVARTLFGCFDSHDIDMAASLVADDSEFVQMPLGFRFRGPTGLSADLRTWLRAFPDASCEITNIVADGEMVVVEFIGRGTHLGPMVTRDGTVLPPTHRRVELSMCEVLQVREGKIIRGRIYWDIGSLMKQVMASRA